MTETPSPEANQSARGLLIPTGSGRIERQALRRQVLLGGATTAGVILALSNRPALAGGTTKTGCDPAASLSASLAASRGVTDPTSVGLTPTCWMGGCYTAWAPGSMCNGKPVSCTHSTTVCNLFPTLKNTTYFQCSTSTTLSQLCAGSASIHVKCSGQWISLWTASQQCDIGAAIVNDCFYGDYYLAPAVQSQITSCLTTCQSYSRNNNKNGIQSTCGTIATTFHTCNYRNPSRCSV